MGPKIAVHDIPRAEGGHYASIARQSRCRLSRVLPAGRVIVSSHGLCSAGRALAYDPDKAKKLLAEAGYPRLRRRPVHPNPASDVAEATMNYLNAVGIRLTMTADERAAFMLTGRRRRSAASSWSAPAIPVTPRAGSRLHPVERPYAYGGYPTSTRFTAEIDRARSRKAPSDPLQDPNN